MYVYDNDYSISELVKLAYSLICTKLFHPSATIVRRPVIIRGKDRIAFGRGFACGYGCRLETFGARSDTRNKLVFGKNCHIGDYVHIAAQQNVSLGDNCLLASHVFITDLNHGQYDGASDSSHPDSDPSTRPLVGSPVRIGNNVWVGENVCVLPGVTIGNGCVIGSGSVVTKDIPERSVAVGAPARIIKRYVEGTGWTAFNM